MMIFAYGVWKQCFLYALNTHFIFYDPYPFCVFFKSYAIYLFKNAQKGEEALKIKVALGPLDQ